MQSSNQHHHEELYGLYTTDARVDTTFKTTVTTRLLFHLKQLAGRWYQRRYVGFLHALYPGAQLSLLDDNQKHVVATHAHARNLANQGKVVVNWQQCARRRWCDVTSLDGGGGWGRALNVQARHQFGNINQLNRLAL